MSVLKYQETIVLVFFLRSPVEKDGFSFWSFILLFFSFSSTHPVPQNNFFQRKLGMISINVLLSLALTSAAQRILKS